MEKAAPVLGAARSVTFKGQQMQHSAGLTRASLSKPLPSIPTMPSPKTPWAPGFKVENRSTPTRRPDARGGSRSSTEPHLSTSPPPKSLSYSRSPAREGVANAPPLWTAPPSQGDSLQARYMEILLSLDTIPRLHNILALFFCWILLAGFVLFPGTFDGKAAGLGGDSAAQHSDSEAGEPVPAYDTPLLAVVSACCAVGITGVSSLSIRWRRNYVWLINRLYIPSTLNAAVGLLGTLTSIYVRQGAWTVSAVVAVGLEAICLLCCSGLFILYHNLLLKKLKERRSGVERSKGWHKGFAEKRAREPAFAPGNAV